MPAALPAFLPLNPLNNIPYRTAPLCRPQREEFLPEVTMDPMRGPRQYGEGDLDDDEEEGADEDEGEDVEELLRRARRAGRVL